MLESGCAIERALASIIGCQLWCSPWLRQYLSLQEVLRGAPSLNFYYSIENYWFSEKELEVIIGRCASSLDC